MKGSVQPLRSHYDLLLSFWEQTSVCTSAGSGLYRNLPVDDAPPIKRKHPVVKRTRIQKVSLVGIGALWTAL